MTYINANKEEIWSRRYWREIERLLKEKKESEQRNSEAKAA